MKPVKTKHSQGTFGGDMPYAFSRDRGGVFISTIWKLTLFEKIKLLFLGHISVRTYQTTQPPIFIKVGKEL